MIFLTEVQLAFVIVCPIVAIGLILFFIYLPLSRRAHKKRFNKFCYKKIYNIANINDYYLINNFAFSIDGVHSTFIDHILFGNKFIYVIMDKYYEGNLIGKADDQSFIFVDSNGVKKYTDNPFIYLNKLLTKLSGVSGLPNDLLVGVTLVNDECKLNIQGESKKFYIVERKQLKQLIKNIESRDVGIINEKQLQNAVNTMDKINKRDELKKTTRV